MIAAFPFLSPAALADAEIAYNAEKLVAISTFRFENLIASGHEEQAHAAAVEAVRAYDNACHAWHRATNGAIELLLNGMRS